MKKSFCYALVLSICSIPLAFAQGASAPIATYILQTASNLGCDSLDIELISQSDDTRYKISFTKGAFAAAELPVGGYGFGEVKCNRGRDKQKFDILSEQLSPFMLSAGKVYYAGRVIFEQLIEIDESDTPQGLKNCIRVVSKARGDSGNDCFDGAGSDLSLAKNKKVSVYLPDVSDEDIELVRSALSATEDQFVYLPLK